MKLVLISAVVTILFLVVRSGLPDGAPAAGTVAFKDGGSLASKARASLVFGLTSWDIQDFGVVKVAIGDIAFTDVADVSRPGADLVFYGCPDGKWYSW